MIEFRVSYLNPFTLVTRHIKLKANSISECAEKAESLQDQNELIAEICTLW